MSDFAALRQRIEDLIRVEQRQAAELERLIARVEQAIGRRGRSPNPAASGPR